MANIKFLLLVLAMFGIYYAKAESVLKAVAGVDPKAPDERVKVDAPAGATPNANTFASEFDDILATIERLVKTRLAEVANQRADNLRDVGHYTCACPPGFTGPNCTDDIDECEIFKPCVFGICKNTIGSYECYCIPGFKGNFCHEKFSECFSRPCQNGGACYDVQDGYVCACPLGFSGTNCDISDLGNKTCLLQ